MRFDWENLNDMEKHKIIGMNQIKLDKKYDPGIFSVADFSFNSFVDYKDIARRLKNKNPYTVTVIIDNLDPKFWNNKKYVEKTKMTIQPLFRELLYRCFFDEFGRDEGNELYAKWLAKYRPIRKKEKMKR